MGANCSFPVASVKEGRKKLLETINDVFQTNGMNPDGDCAIIDTRRNRAYVYHPIAEGETDGSCIWRLQFVKSEQAEVKPVLPTIAKLYGPKPTPKRPFIAMVRFD